MKIFSCACCAALFNVFLGMGPQQQPQQKEPDQELPLLQTELPPQKDSDEQSPLLEPELTERDAYVIIFKEHFEKDRKVLNKRFDRWKKIDPRFDMDPALFDDARMTRVTFADVNPEKKNN